MFNPTKEQFLENYKKTDKHVKNLMLSDATRETLEKITTRYNVQDKLFYISATIGYVLIGLIPIKRFIQHLEEEVGLDPETAKNIAHDVRAEVFAPVAKELAGIQEQAEKDWQKAQNQEKNIPKENKSQKETAGSNNESKNTNIAQGSKKIINNPQADESVVRELFPKPEKEDQKFDPAKKDGLEENKENDSRF